MMDNKSDDARLRDAAPVLLDALRGIMAHGELACVDAHPGAFFGNGGKKPATKDVFQFPRHMLTEIEEAISKATS